MHHSAFFCSLSAQITAHGIMVWVGKAGASLHDTQDTFVANVTSQSFRKACWLGYN